MDEVIGQGRYTRLVARDGWEFIEQPGLRGIVVIVAESEGRLLLVEQFRAPLNARVIELPAGMVGDIAGEEDEPFEKAARRELLEETGYDAERFTFLTAGPMSPGRSGMIYSFYLAHDPVKKTEGGGDEHEDIVVHTPRIRDIAAFLREQEAKGRLIDPKIFAALHFLEARRR